MRPALFSHAPHQRPLALGATLQRAWGKRWLWRLHGQSLPAPLVSDRAGWLPMLMASAAVRGHVPMPWLLAERFEHVPEPTTVVLPCGFYVASDPIPSRWALPLIAAARAHRSAPGVVSLDQAWQDWLLALRGKWGALDLHDPGT